MTSSTKLLISVRSAKEARIALDAGADIIDVKEPDRGSLGAASNKTLNEISKVVHGQAPLSAALGEWHQARQVTLPVEYTWAKVGFSQCRSSQDRHRAWQYWVHLQSRLQPARLIGVVYADRLRAGGPGVRHVLDWINSIRQASVHAPGLLIDTAIKDGRGLLHWMSITRLETIQNNCRSQGVFLALAGALTFADVQLLRQQVQPDVIAVRGAACAGGARASQVQSDRIRSLRQCLQAGS